MILQADALFSPRSRKRSSGQTAIPCVMMRGGTSRGPFFLRQDLPADDELMKRVLLRVMGSPHVRQIDGIGGSDPVTSKVAMVRRSTHPGRRCRLSVRAGVRRPRSGRYLAAVRQHGRRGSGRSRSSRAWSKRATSRDASCGYLGRGSRSPLMEAAVQTPGGEVTYDGDLQISGVNDPAAPIALNLARMAGAKTGDAVPDRQAGRGDPGGQRCPAWTWRCRACSCRRGRSA